MGDLPEYERVRQLVAQASDTKRLRGGSGAREQLVEAMDLADACEAAPWDAIAAYRLAHLIMRSATTRDDLVWAEELFLRAARQPALGPWPALFHIAVLQRLGATERVLRAFQRARDEVATALRPSTPDGRELEPTLQHALVNALELCCYMTGSPYEGLEGLGVLPYGYREARPSRRGWYLRSRNVAKLAIESRVVLYDQELGRAELAALRNRYPQALVFELPHDRNGQVWLGDQMVEPGAGEVRLLANALAQERPDETPLQWRQRVLGEEEADEPGAAARVRKQRSRLRQRLRDMGLRIPEGELLPVDTPVIGLVEE